MNGVVGVIPARYASTRFPGKPLALICGRPMLSWVIEGAKKSKLLTSLAVATDDERIAKVAAAAGVQVMMTSHDCPSGTDRIWQAIESQPCDIIINIQGDEPLVTGPMIDTLVQPFLTDPDLDMATLAHPISAIELLSDNAVKVVVNQRSEAIYFSRFPVPYSRQKIEDGFLGPISGCLKHIGMYGYRKNFLQKYCAAPQVEIETAESLEQLRALYLGARMKVVQTEIRSWELTLPKT